MGRAVIRHTDEGTTVDGATIAGFASHGVKTSAVIAKDNRPRPLKLSARPHG